MASTNAPSVAPETIMRLQSAIYAPMAMLAGMQLDVFTPLKDGGLTGTEIAAAIGVEAGKLMPLLFALVAAGLLNVQNDRFSNTIEADIYLVRGSPSYLAGSRREFYADVWQGLLKTAASIRTGAPQHKHDFHAMSEAEMLTFFRGQHFFAVATGEYLARIHDFASARHILDAAAGSGGVAIGACQVCPNLTATVADLAGVIPVTRQFVSESTCAARISAAVLDLVAGPPEETYDVVVMRNLVQVLSLDDAQTAIRNVATTLSPCGRLFVVGAMLDDTRLSPPDIVGQNLVHLNVYDDGLIYTEGEYRHLLTDAGLADVEIQPRALPGGASLALGRKPS